MKKTKVIVTCDACGKVFEKGHYEPAFLKLHINQWAGGSIGGEEDWFRYEADLCEECARKVEAFVRQIGINRKQKY